MSNPAKIVLIASGGNGRLTVDGRDISQLIAPEVTLKLGANRQPTVEVRLLATTSALITGELKLSPADRQFLVSIGWTPPAPEECP